MPVLLSWELPGGDCPSVRVKCLGERMVAFRDTHGRLGLIDEFCAHRGVSLWFGRNEECGLRCPYHGWKYDVTGQCVEVPSEPAESGFCQKIKLKSYPIPERGGVIWVYMGPPRGDHPMHGHFWVPMDDETNMAWSFDYHPVRALSTLERQAMEAGAGVHVRVDKGFRPLQNKDNDYLIDRAAQKSGKSFSGVEGIGMQDASLQESMGPIQDRTKENLVSTDNGIIMARHRLMRAAKELAAKGTPPPGRDVAHMTVRSVAVVLESGTPFKEGAGEALKAREGVAQTSV